MPSCEQHCFKKRWVGGGGGKVECARNVKITVRVGAGGFWYVAEYQYP